MRRCAPLVALAAVAVLGCNDEIVIQAGVGLVNDCQSAASPGVVARSISVEVIEESGGRPTAVRSSECVDDLEVTLTRPIDLIDWFAERGYLARDIPTDVPTRLKLVAFAATGCQLSEEGMPRVCAASQDTLSDAGYSEGDTLSLSFFCLPPEGEDALAFLGCLRLGSAVE